MRAFTAVLAVVSFSVVAGCATTTPAELKNARFAYQKAKSGPAATLAPTELRDAQEALVQAELAFEADPESYQTRDLSYVAQRKSELAGVVGSSAAAGGRKDDADHSYAVKQEELVTQGREDLRAAEERTSDVLSAMVAGKAAKATSDAEFQRKHDDVVARNKEDLREAEMRTTDALQVVEQGQEALDESELRNTVALNDLEQAKQDLIESEKRTAAANAASAAAAALALQASEKRTEEAMAQLAKLAAVSRDERGMVVTLHGSVLFRSTESKLLASAEDKLAQVTLALLSVKARNVVVEGHTDFQGSAPYNQDLSQRRADVVRDFLILGGYPPERVQARGMGREHPVANNASPEGRANNRRVEIIIEPDRNTPDP